jgi:hypothetical protein
VLALQRASGNRATAQLVASLQRCSSGARCRCTSCSRRTEPEQDEKRQGGATQVLSREALEMEVTPHFEREEPPPAQEALHVPRRSEPAPTPTPPPAPVAGKVCGPNVTSQLAGTLSQIQSDFKGWSNEDKFRACRRVLLPVKLPEKGQWSPKNTPLQNLRAWADINGWDIYALYQGASQWLREPPVCGPCAQPSSTAPPGASEFHSGHEDPATCSDTVQVGSDCWLNGTPNYATYGIMCRLCQHAFPQNFFGALYRAELLIKAYKKFGGSGESPADPLRWVRAAFNGGPSATVSGGNRPTCATTCTESANAPGATWDYVWEPVKKR